MTRWMTLDLRSLAAFRIVLALTILVDLADRARALILYTDEGPVPLAHLADGGPLLSLYALSGARAFVIALFVINAMVAVALGAGWRARSMCVLALVLQLSIHERTIAGFLGDSLLHVVIFWACLLPIGARFSIDSRRDRSPGTVRSFACAGLVLSVVLLFVFTAIEKSGSSLWRNGEALATYVATWIYPTTIGRAVFDVVPGAFPFMTWLALVVEVGGALLLFAPWWRARVVGGVSLFGLMMGIGLVIDAGLFPLITATALIALLPTEAWRTGGSYPSLTTRRGLEVFALVCAATMLVTNVINTAGGALPPRLSAVLRVAGLDQRWPMFSRPEAAPRGWLLVVGTRESAPPFDVLQGKAAVPTEEPPPMSTILTFRERRILQESYLGLPGRAEDTAAWLCRRSAQPIETISVSLAEERQPGTVLVIEIVKDQPCARAGR